MTLHASTKDRSVGMVRIASAIGAALFASTFVDLAAGDVPSAEPVRVSDTCTPESSSTSACVWTADCPKGGCADRCILNEELASSWETALDRATGEQFYSACPMIAYWVHAIIDIAGLDTSTRRLRSSESGLSGLDAAAMRARLQSPDVTRHMARYAAQLRGDIDASATREQHGRGLNQFTFTLIGDGAPAPVVPETRTIPSNLCITEDQFEVSRGALTQLAVIWRRVFSEAATEGQLSADLEDWEFVLQTPNMFQFLVKMFEDPSRAEQYLAANCQDRLLEQPLSFHYVFWIHPEDRDLLALDPDLEMMQCADNFGAAESFDRDFQNLFFECTPPFGRNPDCFSNVGFRIITSEDCAVAFAQAYNITNVTALANVAQITDVINTACFEVTTEAECLSAKTDALQLLADFHEDLPVPHQLEIAVTPPVGITIDVPPPCFTSDCSPPAPAPPDTGAPGPVTQPPAPEVAAAPDPDAPVPPPPEPPIAPRAAQPEALPGVAASSQPLAGATLALAVASVAVHMLLLL